MEIADFKDKHKGEPVALLCNGPSLTKYDLNTLPIRAVGMHRSWHLLPTEYHVILIHKEYFDEIAQGLWDPQIIFVQNFYPDYYRKIHKDVVIVRRAPGRKDKTFSFDLRQGSSIVHCGLFALEVVVWMGFNPIYILGLDLVSGEGHFYRDEVRYAMGPPPHKRQKQIDLWHSCADQIKHCRPKLKIYNANRDSRVRSFEFITPWD